MKPKEAVIRLLAIWLIIGGFFSTGFAIAAGQDAPADTIEQWLADGREFRDRSGDIPSLISFYAERQLGIAYVGGLLDEPDEEQLVVTLDGSDCVLYVETSLALTMTTLQERTTYEAFRENLRFVRYRDGEIEGYESRLHYFSDWLKTNQQKGFLSILFQDEDLPELGPVHFMTANRQSYRHLANDDDMFRKIREMEEQLAGRTLRFIPEDRIPEYASRFQTGDVLSYVTTIDGLDIIHTALVKMDGDRAGFYHASLTGSVIVDPNTIYEYARNRGNINGIMIARLQAAPL